MTQLEKNARNLVNELRDIGHSDSEILEMFLVFAENAENLSSNAKTDYFSETTEILSDLGIPANIIGYNYLRTAIVFCIEEPTLVYSITKKLYPSVAKKHNTSSSKVERCIRNAIEHAFACNTEVLCHYFKNVSSSRKIATNSEFIATLAEHIRMKHR